MKIYTCGDSHSLYSFKNEEEIKIFHLGPFTMHRVGRDKINFHKEYGLPDDGIVIFSFGEIDVRNHIFKHATKRDEDEIISTLVNNYMDTLKINLEFLPKIAVMSIVPPSIERQASGCIGEDSDRLRYTLKMNEKLAAACVELSIIFLDLYQHYKNEKGMMQIDKSDGSVHIKDTEMVRHELIVMGIIGAPEGT